MRTATVGSHTQITGEIKNIQADDSVLDGRGKVLMEALDPLIYDEESFSYSRMGARICDAFKTGAGLKRRFDGGSGE